MPKRFLAMTAIAILLTGCVKGAVVVDEKANGTSVTVAKGQEVVVSLPGNPTTGYDWHVTEVDEGVLKQNGENTFQPDSSAIGAGGMVTLTFTAVGPGETNLALGYSRSFEPTVPPTKTWSVKVTVSQ